MLEFCLEDGTRLELAGVPVTAAETVLKAGRMTGRGPLVAGQSEETVFVPAKQPAMQLELPADRSKTETVTETLPIVLALAHNWWQWIYLEKVYISSMTEFLLSANFLMWLLLLGGGTAAGIFSVRRSANKTFAIIGLVTLTINLILFLVPRR
jgi:hypothetical protein